MRVLGYLGVCAGQIAEFADTFGALIFSSP